MMSNNFNITNINNNKNNKGESNTMPNTTIDIDNIIKRLLDGKTRRKMIYFIVIIQKYFL